MQLDDRLKAVAAFARGGKTVADIGTDHAYVAVQVLLDGADKVIAADLNAGPCESARRTTAENGCEDKIEVRQGDGLAVLLPGEVDTVCIAGMGGELITLILGARPEITDSISRLVLQPMNDPPLVRAWLYEHGWVIADEALAKADGKLYEVICAKHGQGIAPTGVMLEIGEKLWENRPPLLEEHIRSKLKKKKTILQGMSQSANAKETERYRVLLAEKEELEAKLACLNVR